jgi:hypothetical protein
MAERRSLVEGITTPPPPIDPKLEKSFVFGNKSEPSIEDSPTIPLSRVPVSTRIRADLASSLKKASLERQLKSIAPNTLQDILEEAIIEWLKQNACQ